MLAISAGPRNVALALALVLSLALGPAALLETAWAGAREPAADLAAVEASPPLDMVPAHFREQIQRQRSLLPTLMKRGEEDPRAFRSRVPPAGAARGFARRGMELLPHRAGKHPPRPLYPKGAAGV